MTTRQRHQIYLPDDLSSALESLKRTSGSSGSALIAEALRGWLTQREDAARDRQLFLRLERIGRAQERTEEKAQWIAEAVGTFVEHQLTLVAHHPAFTPEAVHLGQKRYRSFVEAVGRRLVRGTRSNAGGAASAADKASREKKD